MKVSLILATLNRSGEVGRFLASLDLQTFRRFELIIVDQNEDDRLVPLIAAYNIRFPIVHIRSGTGLSKARNVGLRHVSGDIVGFPDDDCWYGPQLLRRVAGLFYRHPDCAIVTGRSADAEGNDANGKFDASEGRVDKINVWRRAISYTMFLKKSVVERIGDFDEEIGAGAASIYLSGEETDYLLRGLPYFTAYYDPRLTVHHPHPLSRYTPSIIERAYQYGCGFGKVVSKHRYTLTFKLNALARPLIGMMIFSMAFQFPRSKYYWNSFRGRLRGML